MKLKAGANAYGGLAVRQQRRAATYIKEHSMRRWMW